MSFRLPVTTQEPVSVRDASADFGLWRAGGLAGDLTFTYPGDVYIERCCAWVVTEGGEGFLSIILSRGDPDTWSGFIEPTTPVSQPEGISSGGFTLKTEHRLIFRFSRGEATTRFAAMVAYRVIS